MPHQHIVLNNNLDDATYEYGTGNSSDEGGEALYELAINTVRSNDLRGRPAVEQPKPPAVPARTLTTPQAVQPPVNLVPLWIANLITAILAVVALARAPAEPESTGRAAGGTTTPFPAASPAPNRVECYCTGGTLTFAVDDPGPCYALADGSRNTPDLLQHGGLYIRPGAPAIAGQVIEQSTALDGVAVNATTTIPDVYNPDCTGDVRWDVKGDFYPITSAIRRKMYKCPTAVSWSTTLSGEAETRPPSIYMVPYMCL